MAAVYPRFGLSGKSSRSLDEFARGWVQEAATGCPHAPFRAQMADLHRDPWDVVTCVDRANAQKCADIAELFRQTQPQSIHRLIADPAFDDVLGLEARADFDARFLARLPFAAAAITDADHAPERLGQFRRFKWFVYDSRRPVGQQIKIGVVSFSPTMKHAATSRWTFCSS
jgi:hypothetical protein